MISKILFSLAILISLVLNFIKYDGITIPEELPLALISICSILGYLVLLDNIKTEMAYKSLNKIENILLSSKTPNDLFNSLCESIVSDAGFRLCWFGYVDSEIIKPISVYGIGMQYVRNSFITINENLIESNGPIAQSIINDKVITYNYTDKLTKSYKIKSSISIPIKKDGSIFSVMTIYSTKRNGFSNSVIKKFKDLVFHIEQYLKNYSDDQIFKQIFEGSPNAIIITDKTGRIINVNDRFTEITKYQAHEVIGKNPRILQSGAQSKDFYQSMWKSINTYGRWSGEITNKTKDGLLYDEQVTIYSINNIYGKNSNMVAIFYDITEKRRHEKQIETLIYIDPLTSLYNRIYLQSNFDKLISQLDNNSLIMCLFINVDRFKHINDSLGFSVGDSLLIQIANRLSSNITGLVCRLNGTEFISFINAKTVVQSNLTCERLLGVISNPYEIDGLVVRVNFNIGVSIYKTNGVTFEELLRFSNLAMYKAKGLGHNSFAYYDTVLQDQSKKDIIIENYLASSIGNGEMYLVYQPILNASTNRLTCIEALLRWNSPILGNIQPDEFLKISEYTGYIWDIGDFIIKQGLEDILAFDKAIPGIWLSLNISAYQLKRHNFASYFINLLTDYNVQPNLICLEISDWLVIKSNKDILSVIDDLANLGIRIAIDNFGADNSDLTILSTIPINKIKIDSQLITNISHNYDSKMICQTIINMAHNLDITVIANGVETKEQFELLTSMGCNFIQGYYVSKPIEKKHVFEFFQNFDIDII